VAIENIRVELSLISICVVWNWRLFSLSLNIITNNNKRIILLLGANKRQLALVLNKINLGSKNPLEYSNKINHMFYHR